MDYVPRLVKSVVERNQYGGETEFKVVTPQFATDPMCGSLDGDFRAELEKRDWDPDVYALGVLLFEVMRLRVIKPPKDCTSLLRWVVRTGLSSNESCIDKRYLSTFYDSEQLDGKDYYRIHH